MKRQANARPQIGQQPTIFGGGFPIPMPPMVKPNAVAPQEVPEAANDQAKPYKESLLVKRRRRKARLAGRY
ncbi:MAG: hypothetical protein AAFY34_06320 [Pseudomonadota bacterium]